jgi:hypothetical protein
MKRFHLDPFEAEQVQAGQGFVTGVHSAAFDG